MTTEGLLVAEKEIEVNGYDIDAMGVVSNIVYIRWFEDLRTAFINQHMNYSTMINQGISPILMKTEAEYKVPVTIHDKPVGRIYLVKASKMKWVFQFEIVSAHGALYWYTDRRFYRLSDKKITSVPQVFQEILATK